MLFSSKYLAQVAAASLLSLAALAPSITPSSFVNARGLPVKRATVCNGHAELCERGYGQTTFVGAHNSYAIGSTTNPAVNQDQNITTQLNDGVRLLQMQAHLENDVIQLCHTDCLLYNGGSLQDYLATVKEWLDSNPNEVLTLLIVNSNNVPASSYDAVFKSAGLDGVSFTPQSSPLPAASWPTLGEMIDSGKRLVTFLSTSADPAIPYLIDEFTNVWETAFNVIDPNLFDCSVNRTGGDTTTQLYLINHFLDKLFLGQPIPDIDQLPTTNAVGGFGSLGTHVQTCIDTNTRPPNFLLVDYYEFGNGTVFQVAANANAVSYSPTSIAQPASSTTGADGSSNHGFQNALSSSHLAAMGVIVFGVLFGAYVTV